MKSTRTLKRTQRGGQREPEREMSPDRQGARSHADASTRPTPVMRPPASGILAGVACADRVTDLQAAQGFAAAHTAQQRGRAPPRATGARADPPPRMRHARLARPRPGHARLRARHGIARASGRRLLQTLLNLFECTRLQQIHTSRRPRRPHPARPCPLPPPGQPLAGSGARKISQPPGI